MSALISQARSRVPKIAEAAVDRARLTVVPRRVTRAARVPFVALVSLVLVTGVAGLLAFNTSMQQASFSITELEDQAGLLAARKQSLQMDLERLRDPQRVAVEARRMGMVPPSNPAFLSLADGTVLGTPTPALPSDAVRVIDLPRAKPADLDPPPLVIRSKRGGSPRDGGAASNTQGTDAGTKKPSGNRSRGQGIDR